MSRRPEKTNPISDRVLPSNSGRRPTIHGVVPKPQDLRVPSPLMPGTFQQIYDFSADPTLTIDDTIGPWEVIGSAATAPFRIAQYSTPPTSPTTNDVYLDDGTNTGAGEVGWRYYNGSAWVDVNAHPHRLFTHNTNIVADNSLSVSSSGLQIKRDTKTATIAEVVVGSGGVSMEAATSSDAGAMVASDKSKLDGIEAGADVTDATNVETALLTWLDASGEMLYRSGAAVRGLAIGTNGHYLEVVGGVPQWQALAVDEADITAGAVTHTKLGAAAVEADNIDDDAVTTNKIEDMAVTTSKIDWSTINTDLTWSFSVDQGHMHDSGGGSFSHTSPSVWNSGTGVVGAMMNCGPGNDEFMAFGFTVPKELDLTQDVTAEISWRVSGGPSAAHIARMQVDLSATAGNASCTAGALKTTNVDHSVGSSGDGYSHGDLAITSMGTVITGGTLTAGDRIHGSYGREGTHGNDDYSGTSQIHSITFFGKRKVT